MRVLVEAESYPAVINPVILSLPTKQEPLTFCCMLLISLLLPLPLQTTQFSLRIAHSLLLQLLSMLKVINSAPSLCLLL